MREGEKEGKKLRTTKYICHLCTVGPYVMDQECPVCDDEK